MSSEDTFTAVDLFCGAGGLSWAIVEAAKRAALDIAQPTEQVLNERIELVGVNHSEEAIETHAANHPWARHYHDDIANVKPRDVFEERDPDVDILSGGIECTHWSTARGGKPVKEQKRMPAWDFMTWVQKLRPRNVLVENVSEFADWGSIDDDGTPSRDGETFQTWIDALHSLGYSIEWRVLNCANYGDPTIRKRLFILAKRSGKPEFPDPTHSEDGDGDTEPWRTAAEIINWDDLGGSIWTRDIGEPRKQPLANTTMERIAEGIRRHCDGPVEQFADVLEDVHPDDVRSLRQNVVPAEYGAVAAASFDEPFLVEAPTTSQEKSMVLGQQSNYKPWGVAERPVPTVTTRGKHALTSASTMLLRQQDGAYPPAVADEPVPTISTAGAHGVVTPTAMSLVMPRNGAYRGPHSNPLYKPDERPLHTVTAKNTDGYMVSPHLVRYSHGGATRPVDDPMPTIATEKGGAYAVSTPVLRPFIDDFEGPAASLTEPLGTITSRDRFALCVPELWPWGFDVKYRMLQPDELARAQSFPDSYEFVGTKTDRTKLIGNAVPVKTAQALVTSLLESSQPTLTDYLATEEDDISADADATDDRGVAGAD